MTSEEATIVADRIVEKQADMYGVILDKCTRDRIFLAAATGENDSAVALAIDEIVGKDFDHRRGRDARTGTRLR